MPDKVKLKILCPDGQVRETDADGLALLASSSCQVKEVTISLERSVQTAQYISQKVFQSQKLDFSYFWTAVPPGALADPALAKEYQMAFVAGARFRIGQALRGLIDQNYRALVQICTEGGHSSALQLLATEGQTRANVLAKEKAKTPPPPPQAPPPPAQPVPPAPPRA